MSANQTQTQADILRDIINQKIKDGFDWSSASKKRELKDQILKEYPVFTKEALDSYFYRILKKCLIANKKDPREYGMSAKPPQITALGGDSDMKANIKLETADMSEANQAVTDQTKSNSQSASKLADTPKPWTDGLDADSVSATFSALYITLKMGFPELEALTDDEKKSLGKLWLPAFRKYLSEMQAIVVIPLLATLGMFAPKIAHARKVSKEKKEAEKKKSDKVKTE